MGLSAFLIFKVCHLVLKILYYLTANPKVVKVPSFEQKLAFKFSFKKLFFEVDDVIAKVFEKMTYWWLKLKMRVRFLVPNQNCLNQSDHVTNVFNEVICHKF